MTSPKIGNKNKGVMGEIFPELCQVKSDWYSVVMT